MRIDGLSEKRAGWLTRLVYQWARRKLRKLPDPLTVMGHHGWVLAGTSGFEMTVQKFRKVDAKLTELAHIKSATMIGCPW